MMGCEFYELYHLTAYILNSVWPQTCFCSPYSLNNSGNN